MNEPQRLSEVGADDFECDLIRSARRDAPRPAAFRRTLASIGVGVSLPLGVASVAEGAIVQGKLGSIVLTKWLATGVALGVATAGGAKLTERVLEPPRPAIVAPATQAKRVEPARAVAAPLRTAVALPVSDAPVAPVPEPTTVAGPPADDGARPLGGAGARTGSLPEEVRSIDAARRALAQGDAPGALELLRRYEATFASGALLPEARLLEVKALLSSGQRTRAVVVAKRIIAADPSGPHADAVRALFGQSSFP